MTNNGKGANRRLPVIDDNPAIHEHMRKILGPGLVPPKTYVADP